MFAPSNNRWNVKTPMNAQIDDKIVIDMIAAVELAHNMEPHTRVGYQLFSTVTPDNVHMMAKEKEFKYGKGKEIVAFADGPKSVSGKDMKYVKFFYIFDNKPDLVKPNPKTYTFSLPKARTFWNDKVGEGYAKVESVGEPRGDVSPTETTT